MDWKLTLRMISIVPMTNNPINRQLLSKLFISSSSFSLRTDITWIGLSQSMSAQVWPLRASSWHSGPQLQDPYQKIVRQFCLRSSFKLVIWSDGELLKIYRHLLLSVSLVLKNVTYCVFTLKKKSTWVSRQRSALILDARQVETRQTRASTNADPIGEWLF